jgi:ammonia channel protein AmtB
MLLQCWTTSCAAGAGLLWFGWLGFNGGAGLASDNNAAKAFLCTQFAGAAGVIAWNFMEFVYGAPNWFQGEMTGIGAASGAVAALIGVVSGAGYIPVFYAFVVGGVCAAVVYVFPKMVRRLGIDDRLDAFSFHGVGGLVGTLMTGIFASKTVNPAGADGAVHGGSGTLYATQLVGCLVTIAVSIVGTTAIYWVLWAFSRLLRTDIRMPDSQIDAEKPSHRHAFPPVQHEGSAIMQDALPLTVDTSAFGVARPRGGAADLALPIASTVQPLTYVP